MGRELTRAMKRMSWKTKASITLLLAVLLMAGLFQGLYKPLSSQAAITPHQNWGAPLYNANANPGNLSFTVNNGADRVLVVAVSSTIAAVSTTQTCTVSFGGVSLTEAVSDKTVSSRQHTWLFYLKDTPSVMDGTAKTLAVTVGNGGQTLRHNAVYAAVFAGVDQTTPVTDFKSYNSGTGTTTAPAFATALTENTGDQPVVVMNAVRVNKTAGSAISAAANWTLVQSALYANTDGHRTGVLNRAIPTSNTSDTAAGTSTQACLASMAGISLKAKPTIPILTASGNTPIATGSRLDTDTGVLMQRIQVQGDGSIVLNSITMDNPGTANNIALADIYIAGSAQTVLPVGAVLIGSVSSWSGTSTQIPLDQGTVADRTAGITPKYIYIVYDMSMGQATKTVGSHITGIGVVGPSSSLTGLNMSSNLVTLDMANNSLSTSLNTPVAVSPRKDSDVDVMMQHFQVVSDAIGDGAIELNSLTIEDLGTAPQVSGVKIYVDTVEQATLSENAKLVGVLSEWNKTSTVIPLNDDYGASASDRTVIAGTPKYVYVLYDMYYADAYSPISVQSKVTAIGAASPDVGASGLSYTSNLINLNRGTWSKITSCGGCHDTQNITDGTARNVPDGKFIGSHYKHTNYLGKDCDICHQKPPVTKYNHASGFIDFTGNVGRNYSKGDSFRVSNEPVMGTCSNISCHSNGLASNPTYSQPTWGDPVSGGCGSCHGADGATPPASTAHAKHVGSAAGQGRIACVRCHSTVVSATADSTTKPTIISQPLHNSGAFEMAYDSINSGITYTGISSCSTTYCHSDGTTQAAPYGTPKVTSIAWSGTLTCAGCHDVKSTTGTASTLSGRHDKHMNPANNAMIGLGNGFNCVDCHRSTITNTDNQTLGTATNHVNKFVNYSGLRAGGANRYNPGTKLCTNIYCHSNGNPGAAVYANPTAWGVATSYGCNGCHGTGNALGYPDYANGGASTVTANLHSIHLAGAANTTACADCHRKTGDAGTPNKFRNYSTSHLSGSPEIFFNKAKTSIGPDATANKVGNTVTCSSVICHGSGSPVWGTTTTANACQKCHGSLSVAFTTISSAQVAPGGSDGTGKDTAGNTAATSPRVGAHQIHLQTQLISGKISCFECHVNVTTVNQASHLNFSTATVTFNGRATVGGHATASTTRGADGIMACNNTYCHTTNYNSGTAMSPKWNDTTFISNSLTGSDCTSCHAMPPMAISQHTGLAVVDSFPIGDGRCSGCHSNLSNTGTTFADVFANKVDHVNGITEAGGHAFPYPGSAHMAAAGTTPWTTCATGGSCHTNAGGGSYPVGVGTAPDCTGCHINTLRTPTGTSSCWDCHGVNSTNGNPNGGVAFPNWSGSHPAHVSRLGLACSTCHNNGGTGNAAHGYSNRAAKTRTTVNVGGSFAYTAASMQCNNSYCHSSGQSTTGGATPVYAPLVWSSTVNCGSCHLDMDTNASAPGEHVKHAQTYPISCATCHNGYTETSVTNSTHVNSVIELSFSGNATGTTYSQGNGPVGNNYGTCSTSYCHSTGQSTTGGATPTYPGTPPTWGTTVTNCASCHLNFDTNGSAPGDHVKHAQGTANFACATCHNGNTETTVNTATHVNKVINLSFSGTYGTGTTYSQGSSAAGDGYGNCSTSKCHGQGAPVWGGALYSATVQCENCHGSAATNPFYSTAASGAAPTKVTAENDSKVGAHLAHLTARAGYTNAVACTECHAAVGSLTAAGHMNGSATPTFSGDAVLNSANPSYATGTCSNTYCHGGKMINNSTNGTDITPTWTQTAYLTGTPSKTGDCAMCHGCPPTGYTGNSHSGSEVLADCNGCHGHVTTAGTFTAGANRTLHLNGVVEAAGGTCIGCHSALVTADFVRPSRHVSNGTTTSIVTNFDCIVCHAEGDPTSNGTTIGRTSLHTGNASGKIDLRNVDNSVTTANVGAAGTNYWAWDGRRANLLPKGATYTSQRDNMDTFCLNCHDDNGSSTIAVNNSNNGLLVGAANVNVVRTVTGTGNANTNSASAAQRPFNTNDQLKNVNDTGTGGNGAVLGTYRLTTYGRVLNVKSQFNSGNVNGTNWASHHNLNQYTKRYTTNNTTAGTGLATTVWTAYVNKEGKTMNGTGAGTGANAGLHCSDCHLNEVNAHGSSASWYMLAGPNIAADDDVAPTLSGTAGTGSSISCFRCHAPAEYAVGGGGSAGRVDHDGRCNNVDAVTGTAVEAPFGNSCHGCHGGFGDTAQAVNQDTRGTGSAKIGRGPLGAIHGNNETYTPGGGSSSKRYRFMSGASMRFWNPAGAATTNWTASTTSGNNCYTLSGADQWGSCTKHSGGAPQTINSGRSLTY